MVTETSSESSYNNFDIDISSDADGNYNICARSLEGEFRELVKLPLDDNMIEKYKNKLELSILKSIVRSRRIYTPDEQHLQEFGQLLFKMIFHESLGRSFYAARERSIKEVEGLRIRLHIGCPKLASLPWEYLFDPDRKEFVSLSTKTPIVRYPDGPHSIRQIRVEPPLRILFMIANPWDAEFKIGYSDEKEKISKALKNLKNKGLVETEWVGGQTVRHLQKAMWKKWNIFHFIGHGKFDPREGEGSLLVSDEEGRGIELNAHQLALLLEQNSSLGLVFLNCCEGAKGNETDVFSSTAAILTSRRIPAVVAMQYGISDKAAIEFSRTFYEAIVNKRPIDMAVTDARVAVNLNKKKSLEWGVPALFMRSSDGTIFDIPEGFVSDSRLQLEKEKDSGSAVLSGRSQRDETDTINYSTTPKPISQERHDQWSDDLSEIETQTELYEWLDRLKSLENLEEDELHKAVKASESMLDEDPDNRKIRQMLAEALDRLGSIHKKRKQWREAAKFCSRAIKTATANADYRYHRAICYMRMEKLNDALVDFNDAIELDKNNSVFYWGRGLLYGNAALKELKWASHQKAIDDFNMAISIDPQAHYYKSRSTAYQKLGEDEHAYGDMETAQKMNPENKAYEDELNSLKKKFKK